LDHALGLTTDLTRLPATAAEATASPFARCEIHAELSSARAPWIEMEQLGAGSPYQSFAFAQAWQRTIGAARGVRPMIVVARDAAGRVNAVLPLGRSRRGAAWTAEFLGGAHANFRMGLFRPGLEVPRDALLDLLRRAARLTEPRVDLFWLANQPLAWEGHANPMASLPRRPSPSFGYRTALARNFDAWFAARHARDTRRKFRRKRLRLDEPGEVSLVVAEDGEAARRILEAFLRQKQARLAAAGLDNPYADPHTGRFLAAAATATPAQDAPLRLYALARGERILATFGGVAGGGRFCGAFISYDPDPAVARCSPGQLLIFEAIRDLGARGFTTFDLGVGEAAYKDSNCETVEPLFDAAIAVTAAGAALGALLMARRAVKRWIKHTPWARRIAERLRRAGAGLRGQSGGPTGVR
jgi:CelD/BcsL family acetyltransferase involved in cellulose biosynthesis